MQMLFHNCRRVEKGVDRLWMLPVISFSSRSLSDITAGRARVRSLESPLQLEKREFGRTSVCMFACSHGLKKEVKSVELVVRSLL
jgi:hypothetical protein